MSARNHPYGTIERHGPARERSLAAAAIVVLAVVEVALLATFTYGLAVGWGYDTVSNMALGFVLAAIFIDFSFILVLYVREFLPAVTVVKKRRRKWEDLNVRESMLTDPTREPSEAGRLKRWFRRYSGGGGD